MSPALSLGTRKACRRLPPVKGARCRRICLAASAVALVSAHAPRDARAGDPAAPTSTTVAYSRYEKEAIARALASTRSAIEPAPEGKRVGRVEIVRFDVIEERDPFPENLFVTTAGAPDVPVPVRRGLNALHYTSRDFVIRREMLLREGEPYRQVLADETARNLRRLQQLSVVVIVPIRGVAPDEVGLLVITKDVWSLRLSYDIQVTPGGVEDFVLVPQETNLGGWHHVAAGRYQYKPESDTFGLSYRVPRFGKSWVGGGAAAGITMNRRRAEPEGTSGALSVSQPLYWTRADWAWGASAGWATGVARRYTNSRVASYDSPETSERDAIPFEYRSASTSLQATVTRSFGWAYKNDISFGYGLDADVFRTFDLAAYAPAAADDFRARNLPVGERRSAPFVRWTTYTNNFIRILDFQTLALQEDYRLGHEVKVQLYPATQALGSTRTFLGMYGGAQYTWALGDGLLRVLGETFAERQEDFIADASASGAVRIVSPRTGLGRLVFDAAFLNRYRNYLNRRTFLGGETRLRGYPSNAFVGKDLVTTNVEFRTRAIDVFSLQVGGAVFYDVGDVAAGVARFRPKHSVGLGLRLLIPQLNRYVFRADVGFPLARGPFPDQGIDRPVDPVGFFFTFEQAFGFGGLT